VASATETSATEPVGSLRFLHGGRDKKQAARKGGRGKSHARSHNTSP